jgi:hypothetical protein
MLITSNTAMIADGILIVGCWQNQPKLSDSEWEASMTRQMLLDPLSASVLFGLGCSLSAFIRMVCE